MSKDEPSPIYEDEILDWDFYIEAPKRPQRLIKVKLVHRKPSGPTPLDDSDCEVVDE